MATFLAAIYLAKRNADSTGSHRATVEDAALPSHRTTYRYIWLHFWCDVAFAELHEPIRPIGNKNSLPDCN